jgi:hypothetical protein
MRNCVQQIQGGQQIQFVENEREPGNGDCIPGFVAVGSERDGVIRQDLLLCIAAIS